MSKYTCNVTITGKENFYLLNDNCTKPLGRVEIPVTAGIYLLESFLAAFFGFVIYCKYNSISILNLKIRIDAISNTWWIIYYVFVGLRSMLNCIRYSLKNKREGFFISEWTLATLETLILCFALNYQRKYRSTSRINEEIDYYNKSERKSPGFSLNKNILKTIFSSGTLLLLIAVICLAVIPVFCLTNLTGNYIRWFWIYVGFSGLLHVAAVFLVVIIASKKSTDGPSCLMKILLLFAVLLLVPADIPMFLWKRCVEIPCWSKVLTIFDVFMMSKVLSSILLFFAVRLEYVRLKQECQWAMLNEVQRFSF